MSHKSRLITVGVCLFFIVFITLKSSERAREIYRCEHDYWAAVGLSYVYNVVLNVILLDPFFVSSSFVPLWLATRKYAKEVASQRHRGADGTFQARALGEGRFTWLSGRMIAGWWLSGRSGTLQPNVGSQVAAHV